MIFTHTTYSCGIIATSELDMVIFSDRQYRLRKVVEKWSV